MVVMTPARAPLQSWIAVPAECHFSLHNLPYGCFRTENHSPRIGVAIGEQILDLRSVAESGLLGSAPDVADALGQPTLNHFMGLPSKVRSFVRSRIQQLLSQEDLTIQGSAELKEKLFVRQEQATMLMPAEVGDYTDFYSSREHATNVGIMFRDKDNPLQPNWLHLPVGYHGRSSSIVVSPSEVSRPRGQLQKDPKDASQGSVYGPSQKMDFELEMAFFVAEGSKLGEPVTMEQAPEHIFGLALMNDWSARDIQRWEYVPLGPFGSKNFATTLSPWVVPMEALEPFRCPTSAGTQDPQPLPYLQDPNYSSFNINLEVALQPAGLVEPHTVSRSNFRNLYWTMPQQLVHHTVTGCNLRPGDLMASGTISGQDDTSLGSMLELSWNGTRDVELPGGMKRTFLEDNDRVILSAYCQADGYRVGFGTCEGVLLPSRAE